MTVRTESLRAGEAMLYKLTDPDGRPVHGGTGKWSLPNGKPGRWRSVNGDLVPCANGLHLLRQEDIRQWLRPGALWHVEAGPERVIEADKVVVRKARLTGKAADITDAVLRELAADFAEHVLHLYEKRHPKDMRPREAIAAARAFARGSIGHDELRKKRDATADAAAAAYAAYDAYDDAARSKERAWQTQRVIEVLGL